MSDCHKPTFTFPGNVYHATQVRLYGIPAKCEIELPVRAIKLDLGGEKVTISSSEKEEIDSEKAEKLEEALEDLDLTRFDVWPPKFPYPIPPPQRIFHYMPVRTSSLGTVFVATSFHMDEKWEERFISHGIIYGYAYEGHCYDLPKPKIMIIPALPRSIPDDDCGYKDKESEGYRLWLVDKLEKCVEIEVNQGFVEQLVLEANLPGRRSPSTYRATMALSHRSGSLTS